MVGEVALALSLSPLAVDRSLDRLSKAFWRSDGHFRFARRTGVVAAVVPDPIVVHVRRADPRLRPEQARPSSRRRLLKSRLRVQQTQRVRLRAVVLEKAHGGRTRGRECGVGSG